MSHDSSSSQSSDHEGVSRRDFLRRGAYFTAGAAALAACGSSSHHATGSGSAVTEPGGGASGALSSQDLATIKKFMGDVDPKYAGAGETWNIGGAFPFTTSFAVYGELFTNGLKLGIDHIKQLGGPNISVDYRDIGLDDVVMTRNAYIAFENLPVIVSSLQSGGSIAKDLIAKNKNFTVDAGGSNNFSIGAPYFWSMTFSFGPDGYTLAGDYLAKQVHLTKAVLVFNSGTTSSFYVDPAKADLAAQGCQVIKTILPQQGTTDWSDTLTAIRSAGDFDVISLGLSGNDIGVFLKQYQTSGINKPICTWEGLHAPIWEIAGASAYEGVYMGGVGDFSVTSPNPWADVFIRSYRDTFGNPVPVATPDYYGANYYSCAFLLWQLYRAVKAKGGDVNDGAQIQAALEANPMTPGVVGGTATTAGTFQWDLTTHSLTQYPMAFYQIKKGQPVKLATSQIGGADIKILVPG